MFWVILLVSTAICYIVAHFLKKAHAEKRRKERVCTHKDHPGAQPCGAHTFRTYLMIDDSAGRSSSRWKRFYRWFAIDQCTRHAVCVNRGSKEFSLLKLGWRHVYDPKQFNSNEKLLEMAGLIREAVNPLAERIMHEAEETIRRRAQHLTVQLPENPLFDRRASGQEIPAPVFLFLARTKKK